RANQAGMRLTPKQMFEYQTIAELSEVAGRGSEIEAEQGEVSGRVEQTPIQRWFFERDLENKNHYNQAGLLKLKKELRLEVVREAVRRLMKRHDALRMRFVKEGGEWRQENLRWEEREIVEVVRLRGGREGEIEEIGREMQERLSLEEGRLVKVVWY